MKKIIALVLALTMVFAMVACSAKSETPSDSGSDQTTTPNEGEVTTEEIYIPVVAKGFQHQFWQAVKAGADAAAADLGVKINFQGPPSEADIDKQVETLKAELAKNPKAIALAALSTDSVMEELKACVDNGIPVVGFDSGVPNAPEGAIVATASTNNEAAAAIAATEFGKMASMQDAMKNATAENPVVIGVLSQDATSDSVTSRTRGFINEMKAIAEGYQAGKVSVEGHDLFAEKVDGAAIIIKVQIPSTPNVEDVTNAAQSLLTTKGLSAVFCSNEGAVTGFLAATADGSDLAEGGKYGDLLVAGFDAGATQKNAIRQGWFLGSVTQDPFQIGYQAVELAYKAYNGESVSDVDTGAKWYNAENIDNEDIALLVYD